MTANSQTTISQPHEDMPRETLKRRGLIAGAAALAAGALARKTAQPVGAISGGADAGSLIIGANDLLGGTPHVANQETLPTQLKSIFGTVGTTPSFPHGTGLVISGSDTGPAVIGYGGGNNAEGLVGYGAGSGPGVHGFGGPSSGASGVRGETASGFGVLGTTELGISLSASDGGIGVQGWSNNGHGVRGFSSNRNGVLGETWGNGSVAGEIVAGVYGFSPSSYGVIGSTTASGYSELTAITATPGVAALAATSTVPTAYAAYFQGGTVVQGNFAVVGGTKSAAVKDASGQHRLVYCVESPESWFEDFGKAKLVAGKADVKLETVFAQIVHADDYHVFLTEYGGHNDLLVDNQTASGFEVHAKAGTAASGLFSWRVVAKRKDIAGERLAKFDLPKIKTPDPALLPKLPEPLPKR